MDLSLSDPYQPSGVGDTPPPLLSPPPLCNTLVFVYVRVFVHHTARHRDRDTVGGTHPGVDHQTTRTRVQMHTYPRGATPEIVSWTHVWCQRRTQHHETVKGNIHRYTWTPNHEQHHQTKKSRVDVTPSDEITARRNKNTRKKKETTTRIGCGRGRNQTTSCGW